MSRRRSARVRQRSVSSTTTCAATDPRPIGGWLGPGPLICLCRVADAISIGSATRRRGRRCPGSTQRPTRVPLPSTRSAPANPRYIRIRRDRAGTEANRGDLCQAPARACKILHAPRERPATAAIPPGSRRPRGQLRRWLSVPPRGAWRCRAGHDGGTSSGCTGHVHRTIGRQPLASS